jgi:ribosomal protein L11 methyltransferase
VRVSVRVPLERAEEARARLVELAPGGWEEVEQADALELAVYVHAGAAAGLSELGDVAEEHVAGGWERRWRDFHRPVRVGRLWVCPPWDAGQAPAGTTAVVIDPGQAFGTGAHPTTRLCLELLLECERGSALDVGCGSGVLAIAAAKLGFAPVVALDSDSAAVEATLANAAVNDVELDVRLADGLGDPLPRADVTLANLELGSVPALADRLEGEHLITSGYLAAEPLPLEGWSRVERRELDGWAADLLARAL